MTRIERLRDKANSLPLSPGVYIMKNRAGEIIYVGKSKKLKKGIDIFLKHAIIQKLSDSEPNMGV